MAQDRPPLSALGDDADFVSRHIGPREDEIAEMLKAVGADSLDGLVDKVVPEAIRSDHPLDLPAPVSEREALSRLRRMAGRNQVLTSMIGMGYYGTFTPRVILRNVLENPGWYTAYTPYQAEVSQGRLEALLDFQQMVADMTGLDLANASLLDEATAAAEAMAMAHRLARGRPDRFFVDADTHPQTLAVVETRARAYGFEVVTGDPERDLEPGSVFAALLSYPGSSGALRDYRGVIGALHDEGAFAIMATDLLALALLTPPGELGADIAVGSAQRFGVPMGYGGPHAAFFATREEFKRSTPGRIIGVSVDSAGRPALRMALQTREQHIRRERATSNICTSQVLLAVMAGLFAVYHGPERIARIAQRTHRHAQACARIIAACGFEVTTEAFFDTITVRAPGRAREIVERARGQGINLRLVDEDRLGLSCDETTRASELERLLPCFAADALAGVSLDAVDAETDECIPASLRRKSAFLTHPVFSRHHSETGMMRYLRRLQAKDIALDRAMIPLGSCTMKLNAATEMIPVTWREFAHMHPFAPREQAEGYRQLFDELEAMLCAITGFDAISFQPNAGSQGEYTGLLTIRRYHEARGEGHRDVCLIPVSAHGTNPASAVMAGLKVVVVDCDEDGNIDIADLKARAAEHADRLAALMVTYPSTHGVFEEAIREICEVIHAHGGQVYLDGANLNALVGLVNAAGLGADVAHLNLHKTFCIPHGGGGPGAGPIGVRAHLAPLLPGHAVVSGVNPAAGDAPAVGQVCAAPWGSPAILPITWAYIAMMGAEGLTRATQVAILNANYIARRLDPHFPVVYTGPGGYVAHECIIDMRGLRESCGVSAEDVAKRLVDYGFHAPTMSWPVAETMMVEPTESESRGELDRFCEAMIAIGEEIAEIGRGAADRDDNLLHNAPHTATLLLGDWERSYDRERAFFPLKWVGEDKFWPPVGRVDNVYGDRHLVCTCPPPEACREAAE